MHLHLINICRLPAISKKTTVDRTASSEPPQETVPGIAVLEPTLARHCRFIGRHLWFEGCAGRSQFWSKKPLNVGRTDVECRSPQLGIHAYGVHARPSVYVKD
jgi:hypothetical protein